MPTEEETQNNTAQIMAQLFGTGSASGPIMGPGPAGESGLAPAAFTYGDGMRSGSSCYYGALKTPNPNRQMPTALEGKIQVGDIVVFGGNGGGGNHIQMCTGLKDGKPEWSSDTIQPNFFPNAASQNGQYVVYRNRSSSFNAEYAAGMLRAKAARNADYGGNCANYVRVNGIEKGIGHALDTVQPNAADYNRNGGAALRRVGFEPIAEGVDNDVRIKDSPVVTAQTTGPARSKVPAAQG